MHTSTQGNTRRAMFESRVIGAASALLLVLTAGSSGAIQLNPVVTSGLSNPVFVTHAGDGSNRLFIVEQGGIVKVLQPGASAPTNFLDIHTKVVAGGEQGLLGLAFHPQYAGNGRFFVYYTRAGDGTLVIAEYGVSADRNVALTAETVLLTIPHPTNTNHNGGMLAFGSDGFLYAGVGDGGSANDPPNNAQNLNVLLGKILRIDVNPPAGSGVPYLSPTTNPFYGPTPGLDEIFAYGLRNPWRFSFDRATHQQWVGDVGQGAREEVDTPIVSGGNYGWRVFEGFACTNNDPALCASPQNYIFPIFDYAHTLGRCSITGGYVYRGSGGALPVGTYVYGDFCSGEIFGWDGSSQSVLLDTALNISSFGEDQAGELYVVGLGGTVHKIVASVPCTYSITPRSATFGVGGGTGSVAVTAGSGCPWTASSNVAWIAITDGSSGSGNGTVAYSVGPQTEHRRKRSGTMTIAGQTFTVNQTR
jgi:glucose/arabinose dehydrogenase